MQISTEQEKASDRPVEAAGEIINADRVGDTWGLDFIGGVISIEAPEGFVVRR